MPFVHLRTHSAYSLKDGIIPVERDDKQKDNKEFKTLVEVAKEKGMNSIALTDLSNMHATVKFYKSAKQNGVKPIIGADVYIESQDPQEPPHRMILLCQNKNGYKNLCSLLSHAHVYNKINDKAIVKREWLKEKNEGLIILSGGVFGEIEDNLIKGQKDKAIELAKEYKSLFGDRFYLELQRHGYANETLLVNSTVELASELDIPVVATHPVQFIERSDYVAHEIKYCINEKVQLEEENRVSDFSREQYFKSPEEMAEMFSDIPEAIQNAEEIAKRCSNSIAMGKPYFPKFPMEDGKDINVYFKQQSRDGLQERLKQLYPDPVEREKQRRTYETRLEDELQMIEKMGFVSYFLVVSDFIKWSKEHDIPVGPGRGSGAGSLVAYALKITEIDPIRFSLFFERFINPDRVSLPDFDIDFCTTRRVEVRNYVKKKYGEESVAQIATWGTLKARAVLKDVGRVLGANYKYVEEMAKLIPSGPKNQDITLEKALEKEQKLKKKIEEDEEARRIFNYARKLESLPKSVGVHAGGVLISPTKIEDFSPLCTAEAGVVSQYDMKDVEAVGLIKFDFLGVDKLTTIAATVKKIHKGPDFDINKIGLEDKKSLEIINQGNTVGLFQLESSGMTDTCTGMGIDDFMDLANAISIYRPGAMDEISKFIEKKKGISKVDYVHPKLEKILKPTFGVMIYQEQIMQVAQQLAGYTLGGADLLRRAMGKKKPEEMAKQKEIFVKGCIEKSQMKEQDAVDLFNLVEKFAGYGFNKSHAVGYALLAYQTAYLKANHPKEYIQSILDAKISDTDSLQIFVHDAQHNNIAVLPPSVNKSGAGFMIEGDNLRYSLMAIKKVGEPLVNKIVEIRKEKGEFTSFFDFCVKVGVGAKGVTVLASEALIRAGVFDELEPNRALLLANVKPILESIKKTNTKANKKTALSELFSSEPDQVVYTPPELVPVEAWSQKEKLEQEKLAIGFYLSDHPFNEWAKDFKDLPILPYEQIDQKDDGSQALLIGIISNVKEVTDKKGNKMAFIQIDNGRMQRDVTVFSRQYDKYTQLLVPGSFIGINATIQDDARKESGKTLLADTLFSAEDLQRSYADKIHVAMERSEFPKLKDIIEKHKGQNGVSIILYHPDEQASGFYKVQLNNRADLLLSSDCLHEIKRTFGDDNVKLTFKTFQPSPRMKQKY